MKVELLSGLHRDLLVHRVAKKFAVYNASVGGVSSVRNPSFGRPSLALGFAPTKSGTGYSLAVRMFDRSPETLHRAAVFKKKAAGEAQVKYVGRVAGPRRVPTGRHFQRRQRPIGPGYSVGHEDITAGTIGAFVTRGRYVYMLSNNHVLANTNKGQAGDALLQPGPADLGQRGRDFVGGLDVYRRLKRAGNLVDAALGWVHKDIDYDVTYNGRLLAGLKPDVDIGDLVWKIGRTTGLTKGRVTAFGMDNVEVDYSDPGGPTVVCSFDDQIEITGRGGPFSDGGDSGSLILDQEDQAVGLLFAGSEETGITYANPIQVVLETFKADFVDG